MLNQPFFQITLPLMITFVVTICIASRAQNKHLDELLRRLERIEAKLGAASASSRWR